MATVVETKQNAQTNGQSSNGQQRKSQQIEGAPEIVLPPFDINKYKPTEDGLSPLHLAAIKGEKEGVASLLASGEDINQPSPDGTTAVGYAAWYGNARCVKQLCKKRSSRGQQKQHRTRSHTFGRGWRSS
eukprot:TRINITY_DN4070_c0_g1_i1.p1 TRINITY_DN4070_c0_g1~~TRINITY_DN4070_c0_g1_i1.p1  ORF type:complete len:130 (-),score=14.29 TRINITY_DN4070_c0_g1_i1:216-605(-)